MTFHEREMKRFAYEYIGVANTALRRVQSQLSPEDFAELRNATEQWASGLQLAVSNPGNAEAKAYCEAVSAAHDEVVLRLMEKARTAAISTSTTPELCHP